MTPTQCPGPLSEADVALLAKLSARDLENLSRDVLLASAHRNVEGWKLLSRAQSWGQPLFFLCGWLCALSYGPDLGALALPLGFALVIPVGIWLAVLHARAQRHQRLGTGLEAMPAIMEELKLRQRAGGHLQ